MFPDEDDGPPPVWDDYGMQVRRCAALRSLGGALRWGPWVGRCAGVPGWGAALRSLGGALRCGPWVGRCAAGLGPRGMNAPRGCGVALPTPRLAVCPPLHATQDWSASCLVLPVCACLCAQVDHVKFQEAAKALSTVAVGPGGAGSTGRKDSTGRAARPGGAKQVKEEEVRGVYACAEQRAQGCLRP